MSATEPENANHGHNGHQKDGEKVTHYSSTTSMCRLPASSSSLRVSGSEYLGSAVSMTTKNRSWVTNEKRLFFSNGWYRRGRRFKNNMPKSEPNAPNRIVSS